MNRAYRSIAVVLLAFGMCVATSNISHAEDWRLPAETQKFKPGRGAELATANCLLCHSADYVSTQPALSRAAWKAAVEKMRVKYGAPIATNKVDGIADYLTTMYGIRDK